MLELFPLRSPLLGESLLVSFPPLIYMLKFSGWSRLIRGLEVSWDLLSVKAVKRPSDGDRCFFLRQRPYRPDDKITGGFGGRLRGTTTNRNVDSPIRFPPFRGNGCFHTIVKQVLCVCVVYLVVPYYMDNCSNSRANTCIKSRLLEGMYLLDPKPMRSPDRYFGDS